MKLSKMLFAVIICSIFNLQTVYAKEKVLCFGDSITAGTYIKGKYIEGNSWVNILQQLSKGKLECIDAGRSGRSASQWKELSKYIKKYKKIDRVIIFLGVNDLRVPNEKVLNNCVVSIGKMVEESRKAYGKDVKILILSSPGLAIGNVSKRFYNLGYNEKEQKMLDRLRGLYSAYAKKNKCDFLDLWGVVSHENYTDGLHPNLDGQKEIASAILKHLKK